MLDSGPILQSIGKEPAVGKTTNTKEALVSTQMPKLPRSSARRSPSEK